MGHFELKVAKNGQFYFVLKASNGQVILQSEMYTTKAAALNGIQSVQNNASDEAHFDLTTTTNDKFHFNLKAKNHQVIGSSEVYESKASAEKGIASVQRNGVSTDIREL
jgi:hypothetical protein